MPRLLGNSVIYAHSNDSYHYPKHRTPYLLITNYLNQGSYRLNDERIHINESSFYLLNLNDELEVTFREKLPLRTLFILFDESFVQQCVHADNLTITDGLDQVEAADTKMEFVPVPLEKTREITYYLSSLVKNQLLTERDEAFSYLMMACLRSQRQTQKRIDELGVVKRSTEIELYRRLFLAREYLHEHRTQKLMLDELSTTVGLNKFHLLENFKKAFGITPHKYLTQLKLQMAYHMLSQDQSSVSDTCYALSFESLGSFSLLFKRHFGFSPSTVIKS